jgi:hypothetical protein
MWARRVGHVRELPLPARIAIYFAFGLLTIVVEMFVLSWAGVHWSAWWLVPLPAVLSVLSRSAGFQPAGPLVSSRRLSAILLLAVVAVAILVSSILAATATSGDFVYFWGVKGQRWGAVHFLDTEFTKVPAHYMHPDYPPLLPLYYAWTLLGGDGALDWWGAILATPLFLVIGAAALLGLGRYARIRGIESIVTLFVTLYALFYVRNQVAGNAEPVLHMYECIALAALTCWRNRSGEHDLIAALALSGVALTKVEGGVFVILICGLTWLARDGTWRERLIAGAKMAALPIATLGTWLLFGMARGLTDTYVPREDLSVRYVLPTALALLQELSLHLGYTPWIAFAIILCCGRVRNALPYLAASALFLVFLLAVYTRAEPHLEWSAGRTLMTPLLLFIAGTVAAHRPSAPAPDS